MSSTTSLPFKTFSLTSSSDQPPSSTTTSLTLHPTPSHATDIWRKPATPGAAQVTSFNAPLIYKSIPFAQFQRARVTVSAKWERQYDQGGLVLVFPRANAAENKWVKTGIEFYNGKALVSTVSCDRFADWSLATAGIKRVPGQEGEKSVTLEMEWEDAGSALWIYVIDGERIPIREVTWVLSGDIRKDDEVWVGVYAATPIMEGGRAEGEGLEVSFEGFELVLKE